MFSPRLIGFLYGDGWAYYDKSCRSYVVGFTQSSKNESVRKYYCTLLASETGKKVRYHEDDFYVVCKPLYELLVQVKKNPIEYYDKLSLSERLEFIAGLVDAEGSFSQRRMRLRIYNSEGNLLAHVRSTLDMFRIRSSLYREDVYVLEIKGSNLKIFLKHVHPVKPLQAARPHTRA